MKKLRISDDLALPLSYATSRNMVLAQSGAGKSNVCVVLAEEMHRAGIPWVAIDTKGDWYGIRSNASGKQRGLDVPVFGGEFGDMPLSPLAGARMAELVAAGKFAGVLDVSDFPKASDVSRFLTDFANTLLKKQRTPVHLFLEECSDYLPQGGYRGQMDPLAAMCVGAMKRLATKGRFRGIGYTVISQRAAEVNKSVLYQCETLIALRMIGDLDIKWIEGWVKRGSTRAPELLSTLHELRDGECWIWSPARLKIIQRVQARRRSTFDSGKTPEVGKARFVPKMAPVELKALRKELADLEEQAKADDPKELRRQIAELKKELAGKPLPAPKQSAAPKLGPYEIVVDRRHVEAIIDSSEHLEQGLDEFTKSLEMVRRRANGAVAAGRRARSSGPAALAKRLAKAGPVPKLPPVGPKDIVNTVPTDRLVPRVAKMTFSKSNGKANGAAIGGGLQRMMIALAQRPQGLTNRQLGVRAGISSKSGTFSTYLSRGRSEGWITDQGDKRFVTEAGISALGHFTPLPDGPALREHWYNELGGGARRMLEAVANAYPRALTNEELGEAAGISHKSGTFSTYLSKLRTLELVEGGRGAIRMSEELS